MQLFRPVNEKHEADEGADKTGNTRDADYQPDKNCADGCNHLDLSSFGF